MIQVQDIRGKALEPVINRSQLEYKDELESVKKIIEAVCKNGDAALFDYTQKFDKILWDSETVQVSKTEIESAYAAVSGELLSALRRAAKNILAYHEKQLRITWLDIQPGRALGQLVRPLQRVGVYVPGGTAAYPSTVLMNTLPAKAAGVEEVVMVTPPYPDGSLPPLTLVAAAEAGVDRIFKIGGAQAVAALAFGTQSVPRVDKIVGPGNIYVALAKREVFGHVGIDMIAGPSEIVVVADASAKAHFVAADMLSQAEHDTMASAMLITDCEALAKDVCAQLEAQLEKLPRADIARASVDGHGRVFIVEDMRRAVELANHIAPEHLELAVSDPHALLGYVKNAGAVFLGHYAPEPLGDYYAGPNHVLPTSGTARFFSPLGVDQFIKMSSIIDYSKEALEGAWRDIDMLAQAEGLDAHAGAVRIRFEREDG
ncbi:MAG: histidinol dehydrogenase [Bacillota bacterium]